MALVARIGTPERLPEAAERTMEGVAVREIVVAAIEPSAPIKVELALRGVRA